MTESKKILWLLLLVVLVLSVSAVLIFDYYRTQNLQRITDFESCAVAGYPILEIYPEQCVTPDGRSFVRNIVDGDQLIPNFTPTLTSPTSPNSTAPEEAYNSQ